MHTDVHAPGIVLGGTGRDHSPHPAIIALPGPRLEGLLVSAIHRDPALELHVAHRNTLELALHEQLIAGRIDRQVQTRTQRTIVPAHDRVPLTELVHRHEPRNLALLELLTKLPKRKILAPAGWHLTFARIHPNSLRIHDDENLSVHAISPIEFSTAGRCVPPSTSCA